MDLGRVKGTCHPPACCPTSTCWSTGRGPEFHSFYFHLVLNRFSTNRDTQITYGRRPHRRFCFSPRRDNSGVLFLHRSQPSNNVCATFHPSIFLHLSIFMTFHGLLSTFIIYFILSTSTRPYVSLPFHGLSWIFFQSSNYFHPFDIEASLRFFAFNDLSWYLLSSFIFLLSFDISSFWLAFQAQYSSILLHRSSLLNLVCSTSRPFLSFFTAAPRRPRREIHALTPLEISYSRFLFFIRFRRREILLKSFLDMHKRFLLKDEPTKREHSSVPYE